MRIDPTTGAQIPETPEEAAMLGQAPPPALTPGYTGPTLPPVVDPNYTPPSKGAVSGMLNVPEGGLDPNAPLDQNAKQALNQEHIDATGKPLPSPAAQPGQASPNAPKFYLDQMQQAPAAPSGGGGFGHMLASKDPSTYGQTPAQIEYNKKAYDFLGREAQYGTEQQKIAAEAAAKQAEILADGLARSNALREEAERRENERQMWARSAVARHEKAAAELATQKIDPTRFFTANGLGGEIVGALGVAFAGLGDALLMSAGHQGGGGFLRSIERMVDTDIAVQRANIGLKQDALKAQQGVFAERMAIFNDERIAEASAKASVFEWMAGQARVQAATAHSKLEAVKITQLADELTFKAEEFKSRIQIESEKAYDAAIMRQMQAYWAEVARRRKIAEDQAKAEHEAMLKAATNPEGAGALAGSLGFTHYPAGHPLAGQMAILRKDENGRIYAAPIGGGGPGGVGPRMDEKSLKMAAQTSTIVVNGKEIPVLTKSEKAAEHLDKIVYEGSNYRNNIEALIKIIKDPNLQWASPWQKKQLYEQAFNAAAGSYKQLYALGAYDAGVQDLVKGSFPSWGSTMLPGGEARALNVLEAELARSDGILRNAVKSYKMPGTEVPLPESDPMSATSWSAKAAALGGTPTESASGNEPSTVGSMAKGAALGAAIVPGVGAIPGAAAGYLFGGK